MVTVHLRWSGSGAGAVGPADNSPLIEVETAHSLVTIEAAGGMRRVEALALARALRPV